MGFDTNEKETVMQKQIRKAIGCVVDQLESRTMMSASLSNGVLTVNGTSGNDYLTVNQSGSDIIVSDNGVDRKFAASAVSSIVMKGLAGNDHLGVSFTVGQKPAKFYGGDGNDEVVGGYGNDLIWGGAGDDILKGRDGKDQIWGDFGRDTLWGGAHEDTLVSVGGDTDTLYGEGGMDNFWRNAADTLADVTDAEISDYRRHTVSSFANGITLNPLTPTTNNLPDPVDIGTKVSVGERPLFASNGPTINDIDQGGLGDCWLMAGLGGVAKTNPNRIRQSIVSLGDGTYAVRFYNSGDSYYLRIDGEIGTSFADPGKGNSTWVQLMEKAFAVDRGSYDALDGGWTADAWRKLDMTPTTWFYDNPQTMRGTMLNRVRAEYAAGKAVVVYRNMPGGGAHAYNVVGYSITTASDGTVIGGYLKLRNPWSSDDAELQDSTDDGYVTLSFSRLGEIYGVVSTAM